VVLAVDTRQGDGAVAQLGGDHQLGRHCGGSFVHRSHVIAPGRGWICSRGEITIFLWSAKLVVCNWHPQGHVIGRWWAIGAIFFLSCCLNPKVDRFITLLLGHKNLTIMLFMLQGPGGAKLLH